MRWCSDLQLIVTHIVPHPLYRLYCSLQPWQMRDPIRLFASPVLI